MQLHIRYPTLNAKLYHLQAAKPLHGAAAGHFNAPLAAELQWTAQQQAAWVQICSGQQSIEHFPSLAMVYAGHQFGQWAGQLGDGRGLLIAQVENINGQIIDLHLKGAGETPYSRRGDGRAVLRSVIREYLAGHALNALGVPSSNAVGFTTSTHPLRREQIEMGAMLLRTSDCHIRLGHFEWIAQYAPELLTEFTEQCIAWHYPECLQQPQPHLAFAQAVIQRTAQLMAQWQLVGFAHGVMNTDNLNITGSTLDFGPYGFMERFRPNWINNHSDETGRYTYQNQPSVAHWNLWMWLNHLIGLADDANKEQWKTQLMQTLEQFEPTFLTAYAQGLAAKMGLAFDPNIDAQTVHEDAAFMCGMAFLRILQQEQLDYTQSFRRLTEQNTQALRDDCIDVQSFDDFLKQYNRLRADQDVDALNAVMHEVNPIYILRNHMAQRAIELAEAGDLSEVDRLFQLLSQPFTPQPERERPEDVAPLPSDVPEVMVSCSS